MIKPEDTCTVAFPLPLSILGPEAFLGSTLTGAAGVFVETERARVEARIDREEGPGEDSLGPFCERPRLARGTSEDSSSFAASSVRLRFGGRVVINS